MKSKWTENQLQAIHESGGNILVSAAAGSGKTAVLIERILRIIREKTDVDRLLIVTFTSAAAAELRERLYQALQKELDAEDLSAAQIKRLSRQQTLLSKSYIMTIHAFCQSVIKSNSIESGIDASFQVADTGEISMLRADVMDAVLETWYAKEDPRFHRLIEIYGNYRSDKGLVEQLFSLYDFVQSSPDPEKWLLLQRETFDPSQITDFTETVWCTELLRDLSVSAVSFRENFTRLLDTCEKHGVSEYIGMLSRDVLVCENTVWLLEQGRKAQNEAPVSWNTFFEAINALQFEKAPVMTAKKKAAYDEKTQELIASVREERTKLIKKIRDSFLLKMGSTPEAPYDDLKLLQPDMACLIELTLDFAEAYRHKKYEKHLLDFNDLEHLAFRTLSKYDENGQLQRSDTACRYSDYFEEIYVDEYQDTNEIQDAILSLVSRPAENGASNLFQVGDVKQSIYGFRQARPDLFLEKYKSYGAGQSANRLIILNRNFRSRETVVESVNRVFRKIMTENTCGIDYGPQEALNFGAAYYPETPMDTQTELHLIRRSKNKSTASPNYEAEVTAQLVAEFIQNKYQVYDRAAGELRDITYRDIVILMRAPSGENAGAAYAEALKKRGVPAYYGESGGFFANAEVGILLSFLKVVDNPLQNIHFVAVMRNIYGFTDSEIAAVKADRMRRQSEDAFFYDYCIRYSGEDALRDKLRRFLERLTELREMARHIQVSELVWILMHENHFYEHLKDGPLGELHLANINILYARAILYDKNTNKGLFRFLYYFDTLRKRNGDLSEAAAVTEGMNVVRIMSINKSNGLEFPVVILSETGKAFHKKDVSGPLLKHRTLGLGPVCYDAERRVKYPSVMKSCVARRMEIDNKAEEMRILYVAMTRASEKLIITGSIRTEFDKFEEICNNKCSSVTGVPLEYHVLEANCLLDWLAMSGAAEPSHRFYHEEPEPSEDAAAEPFLQKPAVRSSLPIPPPEMTFYTEPRVRESAVLPAKISVSDLKRYFDRFDEEDGMRTAVPSVKMAELPDFAYEGTSGMSAAERGTAVHTCLQLIDYRRIPGIGPEEAAEYVDALLLEGEDRGFLTRQAASCVNKRLLSQYLLSPLAQRIAAADEIRKEVPFTVLKEMEGTLTAVQGMIDCLIRENGEYTVIDFKTDDRPDAEKYRVQLECYAESVRHTLGSVPRKLVYFLKQNKEVYL